RLTQCVHARDVRNHTEVGVACLRFRVAHRLYQRRARRAGPVSGFARAALRGTAAEKRHAELQANVIPRRGCRGFGELEPLVDAATRTIALGTLRDNIEGWEVTRARGIGRRFRGFHRETV